MVEQYDVYTHYSQFGFTPSMINDDIVFTLQNRFVSMSDSQRNEYGIDDDFSNLPNLYSMLNQGRIRLEYDGQSGDIATYPTYDILIDFDGDGVFSTVSPQNTKVNFRPTKHSPVFSQNLTLQNMKQKTYKDSFNLSKSYLPQDIRDILDANPTINGYVNSFHDFILALQQMDKKGVDRIKQYIGESTEDKNLLNFAIRYIFSVDDRSEGIRIDELVQKAQLDFLLNERARIYGSESALDDYAGYIEYQNQEMFTSNFYMSFVMRNEGGHHSTIYAPNNAYLNLINSGASEEQIKQFLLQKNDDGTYRNDPTIGYGLSLGDEFVIEALKKYNVNVDGLFAGEKLDQGTSRKVALEYLNIKKNELVDFFGEDLNKPQNAYLLLTLMDMSYFSGFGKDTNSFIGPRFINAVQRGLAATTKAERMEALGELKAYANYETDTPTMLQEFYTDSRNSPQYYGRFQENKLNLLQWVEGKGAFVSLPEKEFDIRDLDNGALPSLDPNQNQPITQVPEIK